MNRKGDHLRDGWEAGDWAVVSRILPVPTLEDEDRPPLEEPVLLVPCIRHFPSTIFFTSWNTAFFIGWHLLIGNE